MTFHEVTGIVRDAALARPVEGISVRVSQAGSVLADGTTDGRGRYRLRVPAGADGVRVEVLDGGGAVLVASPHGFDPGGFDAGGATRVDLLVPARGVPVDGRALDWVAGEPVERALASALDDGTLRAAYEHLRHPHLPVPDEELIERAFPLAARGVDARPHPRLGEWGECGAGLGDGIRALLAERGTSLGASAADDLPEPATRRSFRAGRVVVHYTTDPRFPRDRVDPTLPARDEELMGGGELVGWVRRRLEDLHAANDDVAPTYVQRVGLLADWCLGRLLAAPFRLQDPLELDAPGALFEVRVLDHSFLCGAAHPQWSFVSVAPGLDDETLLRIVPHVVFHRVQYSYDASADFGQLRGLLREGAAAYVACALGATPAEEPVGAAARPWIDDPEGPRRDARESRAFWRYVARELGAEGEGGSASRGADTLRIVLEATADGRLGPEGLRRARGHLPWWGSFDHFQRDPAEEVRGRETLFGSWVLARALAAFQVHARDPRFELAAGDVPPADAQDEVLLAPSARARREVVGLPPYGAYFLRVRAQQGHGSEAWVVRLGARVQLAGAGAGRGLIQVARIDARERLVDVARLEVRRHERLVRLDPGGSLLIVVAARERALDATLTLQDAGARGFAGVTPMDARAGSELELDPAGWNRGWLSPDVLIDNDDDGRADPVLVGRENRLKVRLRNRGNAAASGVRVRFWCRPAWIEADESTWLPVVDAQGSVQERTDLSLELDEQRWIAVPWMPPVAGGEEQALDWSFRVLVDQPGAGPGAGASPSTSSARYFQIRPAHTTKIIGIRVRPPGGSDPGGSDPGGSDPGGSGPGGSDLGGQLVVVPHGPELGLEPVEGGAPPASGVAHFRVTRQRRRPWAGERESTPDPGTYYPLDALAVPPGFDPERLVSVVWVRGGHAVGGTTLSVAQPTPATRGDSSHASRGGEPTTLLT